ncbi:MAG: ribonuclease Z [Bacteroidota bacterium]
MFQVRILGTSAAIPTNTRLPSAQVVTIYDRHHLVDCGEGTQMQLLRNRVKFSRLDAIFISHLHGDHVLGIPGLLTSLSLYERNVPLKLFGPAGLKKMLDVVFEETHSYLNFELDFVPTQDFQPGDVIYETNRFRVRLLPLDHRIFCRGFRFEEVNKRPKFDFYKAKALGIPNEYFPLLKQGNRVELLDGRVIDPAEVLNQPDLPMSYAYCSDTAYHEPLIEHAAHANLMYHEATFLQDLRDRAALTAHSTAQEAATIAKRAKVGHLSMGHFSARYKDLTPFLDQARAIFPNTSLAREGHLYDLKEMAKLAAEGA